MIRLADWNWKMELHEGVVQYLRPGAAGGWILASDTSLADFLRARPEIENSIAQKYLRWFRVWANHEMNIFAMSAGRYEVPGMLN